MEKVTRCPDCGSPPHLKHLRNCKSYGNADFKPGTIILATRAQLDFVSDLISQLGYSEEDYKLDTITSAECSKLIEQLVAERG